MRIEAGDYAGALDDLRIARGLGVGTAAAAEAVDATIVQLEKALGITRPIPSEQSSDASENGEGEQ